ncbi:hypothetical protein LWC33_26435 [Pseudonocardia sp. RS11V-5]|uniref:hypothetical protein n=1 Tax=Pseudonocardia terrae TaxID=2905831 RepID=UPI001E2FF5BE|nr:hypothetical protein [Pseudonocardia terrae]MCE3554978.1 hypothetical protein [Pseudonocardia terrae]
MTTPDTSAKSAAAPGSASTPGSGAASASASDIDGPTVATPAHTGSAQGAEPQQAGQPSEGQPDQPPDQQGQPAQQAPAGQQPAGGPPPVGSMPPPGPHGEPPEEPRDATVAALVAELEDEVVVVDEQPRYHLAGCRSLPGRSVIPLPAKEAVELGFTPCGWCNPDRTMAGRHQAAAH